MSVVVQYEKYDVSLVCARKSYGEPSKPAHENQFAKSVEAALYAYPIWKVSFEQCKSFYNTSSFETRYRNEWQREVGDETGILRREYILRIKLIEETMNVLSPTQREFVQQRYFDKRPFKVIAEEMAVVERQLYRIRQEVIRSFSISFGWQ